ncbi:hypothetical protein QQ045_019339 [Rhodiola kirilowii]
MVWSDHLMTEWRASEVQGLNVAWFVEGIKFIENLIIWGQCLSGHEKFDTTFSFAQIPKHRQPFPFLDNIPYRLIQSKTPSTLWYVCLFKVLKLTAFFFVAAKSRTG